MKSTTLVLCAVLFVGTSPFVVSKVGADWKDQTTLELLERVDLVDAKLESDLQAASKPYEVADPFALLDHLFDYEVYFQQQQPAHDWCIEFEYSDGIVIADVYHSSSRSEVELRLERIKREGWDPRRQLENGFVYPATRIARCADTNAWHFYASFARHSIAAHYSELLISLGVPVDMQLVAPHETASNSVFD